jgi:hypothetical protein
VTEYLARLIADEMKGEATHTGGNLWVVVFRRNDGSLAVLDDSGMIEYADQAHHDDGMESAVILTSFAD